MPKFDEFDKVLMAKWPWKRLKCAIFDVFFQMKQFPSESVKVENSRQNRFHRLLMDFKHQKSQIFSLSRFLQISNENVK